MAITRLGNFPCIIRIVSLLSVFTGFLYLPFFLNLGLPISLGPEITQATMATEKWALFAVFGGFGLFAGSFLYNLSQSQRYKRFILGITLFSMLLLILAQLPPLFLWFYVGSADFSSTSLLGLFLHLILLVLAFWGGIATMLAFGKTNLTS
ncbi:hypothetical protein [Paenibacillus sp. NPDC093718]|uniref:hypothetical protein n=1 Tax=Paenibacillus sp. NPDC093718 TaxID=3390601 RepID=UPI003D056771